MLCATFLTVAPTFCTGVQPRSIPGDPRSLDAGAAPARPCPRPTSSQGRAAGTVGSRPRGRRRRDLHARCARSRTTTPSKPASADEEVGPAADDEQRFAVNASSARARRR